MTTHFENGREKAIREISNSSGLVWKKEGESYDAYVGGEKVGRVFKKVQTEYNPKGNRAVYRKVEHWVAIGKLGDVIEGNSTKTQAQRVIERRVNFGNSLMKSLGLPLPSDYVPGYLKNS
jgi:hypothetical protein